MKYAITFPYLRASAGSVSVSAWKDMSGDEAFPDSIFRTWDPGTDIQLTRDVEVDVEKVQEDCRLGRDAKLRIQSTWESPASAVRGVSMAGGSFDITSASGPKASSTIQMSVAGHVLRSSIIIRTFMVVLAPDSVDLRSPQRAGSIVWSDSREIVLEGCGARFPLELVKLPSDSRYAGWLLEISGDFDWPFLGGVRLYINTENNAVSKAVTSTEPDGTSALVRSAIYHDIGRQMIAKALSSDEFRRRYDSEPSVCSYQKASVGYALWSLLVNLFPGRSARDLDQMRVSSPQDFEAMLQHKFRIFGTLNG